MKRTYWALLLLMVLTGCAAQPSKIESGSSQAANATSSTGQSSTGQSSTGQSSTAAIASNATNPVNTAQVTDVAVSSSGGNYTFAVTIASPDTGCEAYANWWEVVSAEGRLLYRRILAHSHVDEQPFTRSGGPISMEANQTIIVRVHMHPAGYSTFAMKGTAADGLTPTVLSESFAEDLAEAEPQPNECTF